MKITTTNTKSALLVILYTSNNILYTLTNSAGDVIFWTSVGSKRIKGSKKITISTISTITKFIVKRITKLGYRYTHIKLRGFKKNKKITLKYLKTSGLNILSICDNSSLAHNGCKKPKLRRI